MTERRTTTSAAPADHVVEHEVSQWLILAVLCLSVFMLLIDSTIVNVAQRKIQEGLHADLSQIQWILDSYILTYAVLLLSCGRMGDVFGRKKLFLFGLVIFTAASALCGVSSWLGSLFGISGATALISARVLQGFGGAFMMPQSLSLLTVVFPRERRGAALGIWSSVIALGAIVGPILGGFVVTNYSWEWVFLINVPVGIGAFLAATAILPESTDPNATRRIDWGGVLLSGVGIFAFVYAMIEGNAKGWTSPLILGLVVASIVLLVCFVFWETRQRDPMMKLELFRIRNFSAGSAITLMTSFGMFGIFFPLTIFLQGPIGYSPLKAGMTTVPLSIMIMIAAPIAGRLSDRIGARWLMVAGLTLMSLGIFFITARVATDTTWKSLFLPLMVTGCGMGLTFSPLTTAAMKDVPLGISGSASGIINTVRNVGQVLGIAVLGSVLQNRLAADMSSRLAGASLPAQLRDRLVTLTGQSRIEEIPAALQNGYQQLIPLVMGDLRHAFVGATRTTFIVSACTCALAVLVALLINNPERRGHRALAARETPVATRDAERDEEPALVAD